MTDAIVFEPFTHSHDLQPLTNDVSQAQQNGSSDPSSSSNSTVMTAEQNHSKSTSTSSDQAPSLKGESMGEGMQEDEQAPSASQPASSATSRSLKKTRARSSSGSMLARLTSRSSSFGLDQVAEPASPPSTHVSSDSPSKPRLDRAALAKPRGKYKSGIDWSSSAMNLAAGEEPFMEQALQAEDALQVPDEAVLEEMAATGSTKATLARAQYNSIGDPIFATHRRAMAEASAEAARAAATSASTPQRARGYASTSPRSMSVSESGRPLTLKFNLPEMNEISEDAVGRNEESSPEGAQTPEDQHLAEAAHHVLQSARRAAAASTDALNIIPDATTGGEDKAEKEGQNAKTTKRKTFMGFGGGGGKKEKEEKKEKKDKKEKKGKKDKSKGKASAGEGEEAVEEEGAQAAEAETVDEQRAEEGAKEEVSEAKDSTAKIGRRRRFNDTRQLNMLASELAAEALLGPPNAETRRASMMSMVANSNAEAGPTSSNASQISLGVNSYPNLAMPQPAFVTEHNRSGSPNTASSSPRHTAADLSSRFEPPRASFVRSQQSLSTPSSPLHSQKAKLTGVPTDMLAGLGDGPYPTLPPRGLDMTDPFGIPLSSDSSPYDLGSQGRNSLPSAFTRSRVGSSSSTPTPKRSVLQMSMHNPEGELQGLTKPPKSGRNTPFGSRAPSRQVTPSPSYSGLREKANVASPATPSPPLGQQRHASIGSTLDNLSLGQSEMAQRKGEEEKKEEERKGEEKTQEEGQQETKERPAAKSRRSFFGRKTKSPPEDKAKGSDSLMPPMPTAPSASMLSSSSDSSASRLGSNGGEENQSRMAASRSNQSLVKAPSPISTNTNTSASSHDRSHLAYSSDAGSQRPSAVTTPEVFSASNMSDPPLLPLGRSAQQTPLLATAAMERRPSSSPSPSMQGITTPTASDAADGGRGASLGPNGVSPASRSVSASTKASSVGTVGRMGKFRSLFAPKAGPTSASTTTLVGTGVGTPVKHYVRTSDRIANGAAAKSPSPPVTDGEKSGHSDQARRHQPQSNGDLEQAYVNPQLAQSGFGTRAAYQSSSPPITTTNK